LFSPGVALQPLPIGSRARSKKKGGREKRGHGVRRDVLSLLNQAGSKSSPTRRKEKGEGGRKDGGVHRRRQYAARRLWIPPVEQAQPSAKRGGGRKGRERGKDRKGLAFHNWVNKPLTMTTNIFRRPPSGERRRRGGGERKREGLSDGVVVAVLRPLILGRPDQKKEEREKGGGEEFGYCQPLFSLEKKERKRGRK